MDYPRPAGLHVIPSHLLDQGSEAEIAHKLQHPKPVSDEKNVWFFWHSGYSGLHPYTRRNIHAWHRRLSPLGWTIRVTDRVSDSPLNIGNFLDLSDPDTMPAAFIDGTIGGDYAPQHTSDLIRWPLLLKYGGVYADVGLIQIGDLDRLWRETVADPSSPYDVLSYNGGDVNERDLTNYFLVSRPNNPLFARCHKLFLELWASDGGRTSTDGMHSHPLLKGVPLLGQDITFEENGRTVGPEEASKMLSDYIVQGRVMSLVMGLIDEEGGWNGPEYVAEHVYAIDFIVGSQLINDMTAWDGHEAFRLMSLAMPKDGETESADQRKAREIVEACLQKSFGFKLAHGIIIRMLGQTLGSLWRKNEGSDDVPGTYAHWLRYGTIYWNQDDVPPRLDFKVIEPFKRGPLLREH